MTEIKKQTSLNPLSVLYTNYPKGKMIQNYYTHI